jgi:hypothetical protein
MLDEIFSFISYICETKYLSIETYGTALTLFHYYTYFKSFKEIDRVELSVACVYLASKINYRHIKFDEMVALCNELRTNKKQGDPKLVDFELDIMDGLGYDVNLTLPYHYFGFYSLKFKFDRTKEKLVHNLINESYRRPLCLFFHPKTICLCAFFICEVFEFKLLNGKEAKLNNITNKELNGDLIQKDLNSASDEKVNKNINVKQVNGKSIHYNFLANYELIQTDDNDKTIDKFEAKEQIFKRDKQEFLIGEDDIILNEFDSCFDTFKNLIFSKLNKK